MEMILEVEVVGTMHALASNVISLWEHHGSMDVDDQVMRKVVKNLALLSNQRRGISSSAQADAAGLQSCMSRVFEAMESFVASCENGYKDLNRRAEEERAPSVDFATGAEGN